MGLVDDEYFASIDVRADEQSRQDLKIPTRRAWVHHRVRKVDDRELPSSKPIRGMDCGFLLQKRLQKVHALLQWSKLLWREVALLLLQADDELAVGVVLT